MSSAQGSNPCTFYSTGDGSSWVDATVHPPCGGSFGLEQYNVCSGKPILNISGPSQGYNYNTYTFYANPNTYSSPTDYEWTLSPMLNNDIDDYGTYADYNFYDAYEGYQVVARAKNTCSSGAWGDWSITNISIYESEQFQMSPNPASEFVTISLKKSSESKLKQEKFEAIYSIRIIDVYGNLKYSATRSGDSFTLPVNNLVDGNYFIQITREKKSSNLKLIVKH
ncbi:MAG: T9SS type A sorting domain-containing protein [Bacteroidales bacterium]|nr:T9SS type A sorting domain-containing protein [Bacteroidales bacterium]